jgi:hypothetical protein
MNKEPLSLEMSDLVEMCRAASRDERLSDGMLYRKAADEIERLRSEVAASDALLAAIRDETVAANKVGEVMDWFGDDEELVKRINSHLSKKPK